MGAMIGMDKELEYLIEAWKRVRITCRTLKEWELETVRGCRDISTRKACGRKH
jgi:hypothetical protein